MAAARDIHSPRSVGGSFQAHTSIEPRDCYNGQWIIELFLIADYLRRCGANPKPGNLPLTINKQQLPIDEKLSVPLLRLRIAYR
jgi:hypothetical protein